MKGVLITGASSGIGEAVARLASTQQWSIVIGYHTGKERAESIAKAITLSGGQAMPLPLDLERPDSISEVLNHLSTQVKELEALVLCASAPPELMPFSQLTSTIFQKQLNINVISSQVFISQMWKLFFRAQRKGHIIGILSQAMESPPWPLMTSYVAAKRALASVLESAATELGKSGLCVSAVSPHYTETPMSSRLNPHIINAMKIKAPGSRFLTPQEVAQVVVAKLNHPPAPGQFSIGPLCVAEVDR